jgi:hypothetical protein
LVNIVIFFLSVSDNEHTLILFLLLKGPLYFGISVLREKTIRSRTNQFIDSTFKPGNIYIQGVGLRKPGHLSLFLIIKSDTVDVIFLTDYYWIVFVLEFFCSTSNFYFVVILFVVLFRSLFTFMFIKIYIVLYI